MWFDAVIIGITLILAIKGFFNGFVKEIAGLIGLIGGLWLAREYFHSVGIYIDKNLFAIKNSVIRTSMLLPVPTLMQHYLVLKPQETQRLT
jgi:uncharacterized membrane protein required for colicin V production